MRPRNPFVMDCGVFTTSYYDDMAVLFAPAAKLKVLAILAALAALPLLVSPYYVGVANLVGIAVIGAVGLNILTGFTGQISIGQGAFMGVGAYTAGILTVKLGLSFWVALPAAGILAALVGAVFGIPSLRLKGLYLAIATLAAQVIIEFVIVHWTSLTNGTDGIVLKRPSLFGHPLDSDVSFYYLILLLSVAAVVFATNIFRTKVGRAFMAIRDRDLAAAAMGINLFEYKVKAFALSSFYAGISGALWACYMQTISPEQFTISISILYLAMIIIGGLGSIMGSIYGACFMTLLPIVLRDGVMPLFPNIGNALLALQEALFGLIIILFLIFEPEGLAKLWKNIKDYFKLWPFSY
ncbi:branched-chain amino acid ABC transporter permease [Desulforudis sp. 1088]|uniref:branched-chain amino acid ABC transporter permease n=1 Tax=unclassified Candidatus Desulforudis TaxID=2635950 RepID=UPI00347D2FD2